MTKTISISLLMCLSLSVQISAQDFSKLYKKANPSVVVLKVIEAENEGAGDPYQKTTFGSLGSGVLISADGSILTAAHVVKLASDISVVFPDGQSLKAEVVKISHESDIALIKTQGRPKNPVVAKLGDSDKANIGDKIFIIGNPMGLHHSLSVGYISGRHVEQLDFSRAGKIEFFQTDAAINTGNSGGPMFNLDGEVIGIVSSILTRSGGFEGLGFAATSNIAKYIMDTDGYDWMGIDASYIDGKLAKILNIKQGAGFLVQNVADKSPAYFMGVKGGFQKFTFDKKEILLGGDILLSANGIRFDNKENLAKFLNFFQQMKKGEVLKIEILRAGEIQNLEWKLL